MTTPVDAAGFSALLNAVFAAGMPADALASRFVDCGGDSIMAVTLAARCHRQYGVRVPASLILRAPRLQDVLDFVAERAKDAPPAAPARLREPAGKLEALCPFMERVVEKNLDKLVAMTPPVDLVSSFALPVSAQIICEMLGIPYKDHALVQGHTDTILDRSRTPVEQERAVIELMAYFDSVVTEKETAPGNDLIGRLIRDPERYSQINHQELVGLAALLLLSAYDTMAQVIGLGTVLLLQYPDQLAEFLSDPSLAGNFVDEMVRYLSVNQAGLPRVATDDVQVGNQLIRRGEGVIVMVNSGNRDESVYTEPDRFDIHRHAKDHVGFGHGLHKCIGAHFARAELSIVFRRLFERLPTLSIAEPIETLPFRHEMVLYGLKRAPVTWRPKVS